jgi:hypothetical protein
MSEAAARAAAPSNTTPMKIVIPGNATNRHRRAGHVDAAGRRAHRRKQEAKTTPRAARLELDLPYDPKAPVPLVASKRRRRRDGADAGRAVRRAEDVADGFSNRREARPAAERRPTSPNRAVASGCRGTLNGPKTSPMASQPATHGSKTMQMPTVAPERTTVIPVPALPRITDGYRPSPVVRSAAVPPRRFPSGTRPVVEPSELKTTPGVTVDLDATSPGVAIDVDPTSPSIALPPAPLPGLTRRR